MKKTILANLLAMTAFFGSFANAEEAQTQRVVVSSYGESVEAATKNAATAALEQVVGSFIDANTLITKRQEISEGLLQQTKSISQNINNYSNGAIEKLTVVNTEQNGQLYKVTVDAVVRMTELKVVLGGLVAKTKIDGQGLFAQIQTKKQQAQNLEQIYINNFIKPQEDGSAYEIDIGKPFFAEQAPTVSEREYCLGFQRVWNSEGKTMVFLPVTVKLKEVFLEKWKSILKEIESDPVVEYCGVTDCTKLSNPPNPNHEYIIKDLLYKFESTIFFFSRQNHGDFVRKPDYSELDVHFVKSLSSNRVGFPNVTLVVDVKDSNGKIILSNSFTNNSPVKGTHRLSSNASDLVYLIESAGDSDRERRVGNWERFGNWERYAGQSLIIDTVTNYYVVLVMDDLGSVENIEVSFRPRS